MYRWTDPIEPDGVSRRPEPPTDEGPAWLTDRPEPRSSYLFGDEATPAGHRPPTPDVDRYGEAGWPGYGPAAAQPGYGPAAVEPGYGPAAQPAYEPAPQPAYGPVPGAAYQPDRDRWNGEEPPVGGWGQPATAWQPATDVPADDNPRHRPKRRLTRPLVIGGAAAAATLVVSLGVGAVLLPGGDQPARQTAADVPAVAAPSPTEETGGTPSADPLVPGSPSASPSAAPTSVTPSATRKATPRPSRTNAPSRQRERAAASGGSGAGTTSTGSSGTLSAELRQVVDLVNQERAKAGCKALSVDSKLTLAAQRHSQDQADHKKMAHDGSDGSKPWDRVARTGYTYGAVAENVAWNYQTPAEVMAGWMKSDGHRKNILNCSYTEIGVGVARSNGPYWTQVFATPR
ncbi:CAP domain-containing protein [Micromonospora sp. NBS 11-29]|uniref:CAP domain-containing protein n=1 Tax=Micromonospora sp. NBS 11-29 TaxID=1960879 RepID=UPI000B776D4C|nr:CAP domain-containing protein [Micromonospora sp. NBS 11-29]